MKKILFIATGGTISCGKTDNGLSPKSSAEELLRAVPVISEICEVTAVQPFSLDSTCMSPREWCGLSDIVRDNYGSFDGFVIAHGTDTMAYAAAALSCLIQNSGKPVVLTGSQLPMSDPKTDAGRNLANAFSYAASDGARGVCVVFGGRIIDGKCAVKLHTKEHDAFGSVNSPDIGTVSESGNVTLARTEKHCGEPTFFDRMDSRVAVVRLIPGMPADLLDVDGVKAVIIECFGAGGLPDYGDSAFESAVASLLQKGIYVIMATQVMFGGSDLSLYSVGRKITDKYHVLEAGKMTIELASMKAMWALAYSKDYDSFERLFFAEI